jgi:hypothetical protein
MDMPLLEGCIICVQCLAPGEGVGYRVAPAVRFVQPHPVDPSYSEGGISRFL